VVITGLGAVTAAGIGVPSLWKALRDGIPGIGRITAFDPSPYPCQVAAEVRGFEATDFMTQKAAQRMSRFAQFGVAAARMAFDHAGLEAVDRASRFAVCFGSSTSAVPEFEETMVEFAARGMRRKAASTLLESIGHAVTNHTAAELGLQGQVMTLGSGCVAGLDAIQWAVEQIRSGRVAGVVAGAADAPLTGSILAAWSTLGLLSRWPGPPTQALRPFDALSDGLVLGEGAGAYVLEDLDHARARGARIHAEVLGHGTGSEDIHVQPLDPCGASIQSAVREALRSARLQPTDIDYINTHGSGTPLYDRAETAAYRAVFGAHADRMPVTSIKPVIGQPFAAGSALQVVAGCFTLAEQFVPATLNHDIPAPACTLDYVPNRGRSARVRRLLVVTRAIGPSHSALVLGAPCAD
jgi:3-oxoacyl-[acyl-carrier-protein] synthase II